MTETREAETHDAPGNDGDAPHWRGINHLALITDDMDATVEQAVGARLGTAHRWPGRDPVAQSA